MSLPSEHDQLLKLTEIYGDAKAAHENSAPDFALTKLFLAKRSRLKDPDYMSGIFIEINNHIRNLKIKIGKENHQLQVEEPKPNSTGLLDWLISSLEVKGRETSFRPIGHQEILDLSQAG